MTTREFIDFLNIIEKLKCNTRHSWTSTGRHESVAEHSWRLGVMAILVSEHFPNIDISKVTKMCLIHDFGEAITGDIPAFLKTENDEKSENIAILKLMDMLSNDLKNDFTTLFEEMENLQTSEAKLFKALDNMEALISHNEAPIETWIPQEYELNLTYGEENVLWHNWLIELKKEINQDCIKKIENECVANNSK